MSDQKSEMNDHLSEKSSVFGLKIWVIAGVSVGASLVLVVFFITLWLASRRTKAHTTKKPQIPAISKEIQEIKIDPVVKKPEFQTPNHRQPYQEPPAGNEKEALLQIPPEEESPVGVQIGRAKGHQHMISCPGFAGNGGGGEQAAAAGPDVSHLGWGHWYTLRELYEATGGFSGDNVVGEGGYGIVYRGVLRDNKLVAIKNLLNNKGQAEREFKVEVEAIGRVRHKNLVRFLGYCAEGSHRMLVYEFMNNGNLEQWLHGDVGPCSPLTWEIRMNIILGTAKGLTYLHEGLEPKVVHRDIKSSNILLDKLWNSKVSDFGLAKLLCLEKSYVTTRVMGTFGYVAPEYASTGMLNESSDVYSFGILIMEIISGRNPVDYSRPPEEVNLVDWLKKMVSERNSEGVLDPKLPEKPCSRALKRALLVAFRCVDPNVQKRPKMGHIVHMLEADSLIHKDDKRGGAGLRRTQSYNPKGILVEKSANKGVLMNGERGRIDQDFQGENR